MDFEEFEQLVLRILFETDLAITPAHVAYLGGVPIRIAERHLARMAEEGSLLVRAADDGGIEYVYPGRRKLVSRGTAGAPGELPVDAALMGPMGPDGQILPLAPRRPANALTAVLLSMLVPGAGHIYSGRSGAGVAWMATTLVGYACWFLPGLFLHGLCLVSASQARQS